MLVHHTNAVALGLQLYLKGNSGTGVSCEFYEISKNIFFHRTPLVAASDHTQTHFIFILFNYLPCQGLNVFMSYLCNLFFVFIFSMINVISLK